MLDRPWPWLSSRIEALLVTPHNRVLVPADDGYELRPFYTTRIQQAIAPK